MRQTLAAIICGLGLVGAATGYAINIAWCANNDAQRANIKSVEATKDHSKIEEDIKIIKDTQKELKDIQTQQHKMLQEIQVNSRRWIK
jgi:hypothetical protein